jgi:hypothetical protein
MTTRKHEKIIVRRWLLPAVAIGLFVVSICLPTADFLQGCGPGLAGGAEITDLVSDGAGAVETFSGWELLLYGPLGLLAMQPGALGWLATPLGASALIVRGRSKRVARGLAVAALLLAVLSLRLTDLFPLPTGVDAACHLAAVGPRMGYWVWLAALADAALSTWVDTGERQ